jgi:hypothetical protein
MDMLHKRYACPFPFIQGMIDTRRLSDFVADFVLTVNKEMNEKTEWEYYLHRVYDKSFDEWKSEMQMINKNQNMTDADVKATINNTNEIINIFNSQNKGVKAK